MKILFVTPFFPYPLNSGGNQAQYVFIDELQKSNELALVYPKYHNTDDQPLRQKWRNVSFFPYCTTVTMKVKNKIRGILKLDRQSKFEFRFSDSISKDFFEHVSDVVQQFDPDLLQFDFFSSTYFGYAFPEKKKIFVQHEIRFVKNARIAKEEGICDHYNEYNAERIKNEEIAALKKFDAVITLTDVDREILKSEGVKNVYSSPAGVDVNFFENPSKSYNGKIVFVGGFSHEPNVSGLRWFLDNVWENVCACTKNDVLYVIGNWPKSEIEKFSKYPRVEFLGFIENLDFIIDSIMIVPILVGSGMRMKILDAAARGVPFVSTPIGAEGMPFVSGRDCFIVDDAKEFGAKVLALIRDPFLWEEKSSAAFNIARINYSQNVLVEKRKKVYELITPD